MCTVSPVSIRTAMEAYKHSVGASHSLHATITRSLNCGGFSSTGLVLEAFLGLGPRAPGAPCDEVITQPESPLEPAQRFAGQAF